MTIQQLQQYPMGEKGLRFLIKDHERGVTRVDYLDAITTDNLAFKISPDWYFDCDENEADVTPVLYPLTTLNQEIEVYGERFVPMDRIKDKNNRYGFSGSEITEMGDTDYRNINTKIIHTTCGSLPFWIIQLLQSWFINYQGIEAVNPFDLEVNPYK